jgi:hypothetical protein
MKNLRASLLACCPKHFDAVNGSFLVLGFSRNFEDENEKEDEEAC